MPIFNCTSRPRVSVLIAGLILSAAAGPTIAMASPVPGPTLFGPVQHDGLKHLPAGQDELTFRGESATRTFPVILTRSESDLTKVFQLNFKNTVAALPERSGLTVRINGQLLATLPVDAANTSATVPVTIPSGTLRPGRNTVNIGVTMAHRVDCSTAATYELWTALDPAQTGFIVPASNSDPARSLLDVASQALASDGTTRIALRTPETGPLNAAAIQRAARLIDAIVVRAGLVRPVVDASSGSGTGPGFDVAFTTGQAGNASLANLQVIAQEDGLTFARDPGTRRLVLLMSGANEADLDAQVADFASKPARVPRPDHITAIKGQTRVSFGDLGMRSDAFSGRRYNDAIDFTLPADFYPADTDKARLLIDGRYAANLDPDSALVFRVNGTLVSSLRLGTDGDGELRHSMVELPLRFFHPGGNRIAIEGTTTTAADQQCDAAAATSGTRLKIEASSEFIFPQFAHLGTAPQIPGALDGFRADGQRSSHVYLADTDLGSVGAGLTVLANMAIDGNALAPPTVHIGRPTLADVPGLVVSPRDALPTTFEAALDGRATANPETSSVLQMLQPGTSWFAPATLAKAKHLASRGADVVQRWVDVRSLVVDTDHLLRRQGFLFDADDNTKTLPITAHTLLIAAIDPRLRERMFAGVEVPRFVEAASQWLVVTAVDGATLQRGLVRMVSDGHWTSLQGRAVGLDTETGALATVQPRQILYVVPDHLVLSDVRPILGGLVSNNIELSLATLVLLMVVLGLSTHAVIRRAGSK